MSLGLLTLVLGTHTPKVLGEQGLPPTAPTYQETELPDIQCSRGDFCSSGTLFPEKLGNAPFHLNLWRGLRALWSHSIVQKVSK